MCFNNNISVNCSFTDEGILNVRFTSNLQVGSGKKISVIVIGVTNPAIDTDYSFPCTVNNSNFSTGVRTNLIVGSGKLAGGITTTGFTANGSLRFLTAPTPVSDKNPRNTSTHRFRVTFDTAVGLTTLPVTIAGTPVLYVYLPVNYRLALYSSKPTVTIEENTNDANNVTTKTNTYTPASIIASGNRIYIELTQASVTFGTNFRFWDIVISNVVNPSETTVQAGPPATQTSRAYFVTLTNKSLTALYRTYSNVNTYVSDALTTPVDSWLGWNRGNSFVFDNSKYIVDIYAVATQLNVVTIKPGRYLQTYFNMKPNSNTLLAPAVTTLTLTDNVFKLLNNSYTLPSSSNGPLGFMIGCACGTAPGSYVINFTSSETTLFGALSPVLVTVNSSTKATISTSVPANVPAGGSAFVGILLSDPNFDLFTVSWVNGDNANNDTSAKLTDAKVAPGTNTPAAGSTTPSPAFSTFTITNQSTTLPAQVFKTSDPNTCYTFGTTNTVSINISGTLGKVATDLNLSSNFKYFNSLTDPKLDKNAIRFQFTAPTVPVYIFCALSCINMAYPQDADILVPKLAPTNLIQFYSNYITTLTPLDIVFTNLVRGQQYHLRCLVQSAQGDPTLRTTASISFENFAVTGGNSTTINISPQASQPTQCAQFQFLADPGTASKNLLVNYCQTVFSAPGSDANGCPICTTSDMSYFPAGLSFPQNITCTATTKSRLRFLQASTASPAAPSNTTSTDVPTTLTVCPVPSPICKTDIAAGGKSYNDYLNAFTGALKTVALFKTNLNVDIKLNSTTPFIIINDATVPDITKVTGVIGTPATTGALSFTLNGISPVVCYWQLTDSTTAPVFTALSGCTDPSWCGKVRVGAATTTVNMGTPLKPFSATSTYNIYIGCTNDIPMSQQFSAVKSIGTAALPQSSNSTVAPPTPSNSTSPSTPGSSSFINTSLFALLLILSLIFN
jgi:hypothetical protein